MCVSPRLELRLVLLDQSARPWIGSVNREVRQVEEERLVLRPLDELHRLLAKPVGEIVAVLALR